MFANSQRLELASMKIEKKKNNKRLRVSKKNKEGKMWKNVLLRTKEKQGNESMNSKEKKILNKEIWEERKRRK